MKTASKESDFMATERVENTEESRKKVIEYLYGDLTGDEREKLEERLFADEEFSLFADDVENDLLDEYVREEFSPAERKEFESKYLITKSRREKVIVAETLYREVFSTSKSSESIESSSFAEKIAAFFHMPNLVYAGGLSFLILAVLLGGIWLATRKTGNENIARDANENTDKNILSPIQEQTPLQEISPTPLNENLNQTPDNSANLQEEKTNRQRNINSENKADKPTLQPTREKPEATKTPQQIKPTPKVFVASIFPPLRSGTAKILNIPKSAKTVRLQLFDDFGENFEKFFVILDGSGGRILTREIKASKKRANKSITLDIRADTLENGNYEITVKGVKEDGAAEEITFFNFGVKKD